ncbi:TIGR02996 domain-containing protein [Myxococcus landrumensis]|uniref:TIGR02996 domain-containing protein n=1 Tax=Myxococcus landrumensis TaxID=2813577 RepID=A0ABX7N2E7_9BACT|nr:TIGR02996 domain-containing protein [Myxococcus landrumus]QSQ12881.1 TIGR02996 domain-containing protein [Myxococcus landrumus]
MPTPKLASLLEPANQGDWSRVLQGLLVAWRAAPNPELARCVVNVGNKLASEPAPSKDWDTLAKTQDAAVLATLLATLLDKGSVKARARLETLADWPLDPRIDRWVAGHFADPPFTSTGARPFWTRLAPLARRIQDTQAASTVLKARSGYDEEVDAEEFLARHVDRIRAELEAAKDTVLSEEEAKVLGKLDAALTEAAPPKPAREGDAKELLARVLEKPEDDEARAVLADILLEQEHPRGELIALQLEATRRELTAAEKKRERAILKTARKELLGPLDEVLKPDCVFTRGFLSHAALKQGSARAIASAIAKTVGHPLWATVEHLEGRGDSDVTTHEVMKSLRSLAHSDVGCAELAKWPRLEALVDTRSADEWLDLAKTPGAFPGLRRLDRTASLPQVADFLRTPLVARLEQLQLRLRLSNGDAEAAAALFDLVRESKVPEVTFRWVRLTVKDWSSGYRFTRTPSGQYSVHVFTTKMNDAHEDVVQADVLTALEQVARLKPETLTLAHQFETRVKTAVERRARELGATLDE